MIVGGFLLLAIPLICLLLALVSVAVAAAVMSSAPLGWVTRLAVALVAVAIGFAPIVTLVVALSNWPAGE